MQQSFKLKKNLCKKITVDLHCGQIQGFFHATPVDNLSAENEFVKYIEEQGFDKDKLTIVSPDAGGLERARRVADKVHANGVVTILKRRKAANVIEEMIIVGDVTDHICVIIDDMIDTAGLRPFSYCRFTHNFSTYFLLPTGTLTKAASLLKEQGAGAVYCCATHGIFSGPALERINNSELVEVCVTDSIPQEKNVAHSPKLKVLSIVSLLAEAIQRLHSEKSLSALFI